MNAETRFSKNLLAELMHQCGELPYHIFRVESNLTAQGIPDIYCCVNGSSFWIETKYGEGKLTPLQISWHIMHRYAEGLSFMARLDDSGYHVMWDTYDKKFDSIYSAVEYILKVVEEDAAFGTHEDKRRNGTD
jgi:hypothetical protein